MRGWFAGLCHLSLQNLELIHVIDMIYLLVTLPRYNQNIPRSLQRQAFGCIVRRIKLSILDRQLGRSSNFKECPPFIIHCFDHVGFLKMKELMLAAGSTPHVGLNSAPT